MIKLRFPILLIPIVILFDCNNAFGMGGLYGFTDEEANSIFQDVEGSNIQSNDPRDIIRRPAGLILSSSHPLLLKHAKKTSEFENLIKKDPRTEMTPLMEAFAYKNFDKANSYIDRINELPTYQQAAVFGAQDKFGANTLSWAIAFNEPIALRMLDMIYYNLPNNIQINLINSEDKDGVTAIMRAARYGEFDIIRKILSRYKHEVNYHKNVLDSELQDGIKDKLNRLIRGYE